MFFNIAENAYLLSTLNNHNTNE